ncbi:MAG: UDP-3-O-acylglucosamine N-acyltransferase [Melioribacteraceae bacterium]|nr:MAG: UDP-3-O-acylglucosamine N-acyltransferase [Melioribacteraceae bacterium]
MEIRIKDAADLVGGSIIGDSDSTFRGIAKIFDAGSEDLTFLYLPNYLKHLDTTKAKVVLIKPEFERKRDDLTYILVDNPDKALQKIVEKYFTYELELDGVDSSASVGDGTEVSDGAALGKNVVVGKNGKIGKKTRVFHNTVIMDNVQIGENCLIYPNVTIRENCIIGNDVIIHSGSVIGSDGFGYNPNALGEFDKVPQVGNVIIEDKVEIGSNVSIDRAAIGSTIIGFGSKLDNLVQIAHNVEIGKNTAISAQSGVSGSTKVGNHVILAGQVGVAGHIEICDQTIVGAQTGVSKSIKKPGRYFGYPAKEVSQSHRLEGHYRSLPKYAERISELEKKLSELEEKLNR